MRNRSIVALSAVVLIGMMASAIFLSRSEKYSADCLSRWKETGFERLFGIGPADVFRRGVLPSWNDDEILNFTISLERKWTDSCDNRSSRAFVNALKRRYLSDLGISVRTDADLERGFRVFVGSPDERKRLRSTFATAHPKDLESAISAAYGVVGWIEEIPVIGALDYQLAWFRVIVGAYCGEIRGCAFWDPRRILQVRFTQVDPMAAWVDSLGSLVLSLRLVNENHRLHQFVVAHELAHARIAGIPRAAEDYARAIGWKRASDTTWIPPKAKPIAESRGDDLTSVAPGSPYSFLPDAVLQGDDGEGYLFARNYRDRNPEEDLADAVAAFRLATPRFCWKNKALSLKRFKWIAANVFNEMRQLKCSAFLPRRK